MERAQDGRTLAQAPPELWEIREPTDDRLAVAPFRHECKIPRTAPLPPLEEQPPLAPGTPMPSTFLDILEPWAARRMVAHWNQLQRCGM